jgi:hypothetical protein
MTFYPERDLVLVNYRTGKSEGGNSWAMVTLADPETYENLVFSLHRDQDPNRLVARERYRVAIDVGAGKNGNFYSATLLAPNTKPKPAA